MSSTLTEILSALADALVGQKRLAVIGAVARNAWAPPRATTDLDVSVASASELLEAIQRSLEGLGYARVRSHRTDPSDSIADLIVLRAPKGSLRQVDLLVAKTAFEVEVLRRAVPIDIAGVTLPVATPEDLIVYKLVADRPRDREDIVAILRTQQRAARTIDWTHIDRWAAFWNVSERLAALRSRE